MKGYEIRRLIGIVADDVGKLYKATDTLMLRINALEMAPPTVQEPATPVVIGGDGPVTMSDVDRVSGGVREASTDVCRSASFSAEGHPDWPTVSAHKLAALQRALDADQPDTLDGFTREELESLAELSLYAGAGEGIDWTDIARRIRATPATEPQEAINIAIKYGGIDGGHHKTWVIDQMVRVLAGDHYGEIVRKACDGEDGPDTYEWDTGIAP